MELANLFTAASPDALDLLRQLLALNPMKRATAKEALAHPYFTNDPLPTPINKMPSLPLCNAR